MKLHLAVDLGGTKTLLNLFNSDNASAETLKQQRLECANYENFTDLLRDFLGDVQNIDFASIAIAGPINNTENNQLARVTNLPWQIDRNELQITFNIKQCYLINDFQAIGFAIPALEKTDYLVLQEGTKQDRGTKAVIGAGTGLGQAIIAANNSDYTVISTEGGHVDFAPNNEIETKLIQFLRNKWSHVSYERVLSGAGIGHIYEFLAQESIIPDDTNEILHQSDPAAHIAKLANEQHPGAQKAMQLFTQIYGAQTGNLALNCLPFGGLYIAGGIAAKNQALINSDIFLESYRAKGRMQMVVKNIPLYLVTNTDIGLIGATQHALKLGNQQA